MIEAAASLGTGHIGIQCDVTDLATGQNAVEASIKTLGHVDILINNAGITGADCFAFLALVIHPAYEFVVDEVYVTTPPALGIVNSWRAAALPVGIGLMLLVGRF